MHVIRRAEERGVANFDWLDSNHTFSFGRYFDPRFMGFGPLRVINEDRLQPGRGFDTHGHRDMEIISYVVDGALEHEDSMGNGSIIRPGEVQRMTAGTGIRHSEFNHSQIESVHFLQIWIVPEIIGLRPDYEQKAFAAAERHGRLRLVGSRDGRDGSVTIHQHVDLYASLFDAGDAMTHSLGADRQAWVQVIRGRVNVNGTESGCGDGVALTDEATVAIRGVSPGELLFFDMGA